MGLGFSPHPVSVEVAPGSGCNSCVLLAPEADQGFMELEGYATWGLSS